MPYKDFPLADGILKCGLDDANDRCADSESLNGRELVFQENDRQGYGHNGQGGCDRRDQDRISDRQPVVDKGDRPGFDGAHQNNDVSGFRRYIGQTQLSFYQQGENG